MAGVASIPPHLQTIADVLGVNRETAKSRLRYAVSRLKDALKEPVR